MNGPGKPLRTPLLVLFDLDGTLVDSVRDLARAAQDMLAELGRSGIDESCIRSYVGNGVERLVHRCLTSDMQHDAEPRLFARALDCFNERYRVHNGLHSRLYDGAVDGLDAAAACGAKLGCVTNKPSAFAEPLLARFGLLERFDVVVGGDTTPHKKPHPEPLLHAARVLGTEPGDTLLVGDSDTDVRAARAAGMTVACVSYGYNHGRDIAESAPDAVLSDLGKLASLLGTSRALAPSVRHPS